MAKKLTLTKWAARTFDPPPHKNTLRAWARDCKISPPPKKIGREWFVDESARYVNNHSIRLEDYGSPAP